MPVQQSNILDGYVTLEARFHCTVQPMFGFRRLSVL
jgi:hypothetical protein